MKSAVYAVYGDTGGEWRVSLDLRIDRRFWFGKGAACMLEVEPELSWGQALRLRDRLGNRGIGSVGAKGIHGLNSPADLEKMRGRIADQLKELGLEKERAAAVRVVRMSKEELHSDADRFAAWVLQDPVLDKLAVQAQGKSLLPEEWASLLALYRQERLKTHLPAYLQAAWLRGRLQLSAGIGWTPQRSWWAGLGGGAWTGRREDGEVAGAWARRWEEADEGLGGKWRQESAVTRMSGRQGAGTADSARSRKQDDDRVSILAGGKQEAGAADLTVSRRQGFRDRSTSAGKVGRPGPKEDAFCRRCGTGAEGMRWTECLHCGQLCPYCERCLNMGRVRSCSLLIEGLELPEEIPSTAPLLSGPKGWARWIERWGLSLAQTEASLAGLRFLGETSPTGMEGALGAGARVGAGGREEGAGAGYRAGARDGAKAVEKRDKRAAARRFLIWAVTGAGKTEMIFPLIQHEIEAGRQVLLATPRRDVVLELLPRLRAAFPDTPLVALYGGSEQRWERGRITLATTHQLIRFRGQFDLAIIDELDAFPYRPNFTRYQP